MLRSVFTLALMSVAFVACKKNKTEDPPIDKQQTSYFLDGMWRVRNGNMWGAYAFNFNSADSTYERVIYPGTITEQGTFHTRAFNHPDSLEMHLVNDTLILVKQDKDNVNIQITSGDSTRLYRKVSWPG